MPLQIYCDEPPGAGFLAYDTLNQTDAVNRLRKYWITMGGFAVANNLNDDTALATSGAGPCQIIIVHKGRGRGALGHYAGHDDAHWIVRGVSQMIRGLGGHPVADVVFAAGEIGAAAAQQKYKDIILDWVRILCPGAQVHWPAGPSTGGHWGAAYYLPLAEEIGLFESQPDGGWEGFGDAANGITVCDYWFTAPPAPLATRPRRLSLTPPPTRPWSPSV
jgi:hypothetical protein